MLSSHHIPGPGVACWLRAWVLRPGAWIPILPLPLINDVSGAPYIWSQGLSSSTCPQVGNRPLLFGVIPGGCLSGACLWQPPSMSTVSAVLLSNLCIALNVSGPDLQVPHQVTLTPNLVSESQPFIMPAPPLPLSLDSTLHSFSPLPRCSYLLYPLSPGVSSSFIL